MTWKALPLVLASTISFVVGAHPKTVSMSRVHLTKEHRWIPRYHLYAPLPETAGIGFQVSPTKPQFPTVYRLTDFKNVHFANHGRDFDFTFLNAQVALNPTPPLGPGYPKITLNKPIPVHTPWVRAVVLHPVAHNIVVTCYLRKPARRASLGTSPTEFDWAFHAK